MYILTGQHTLSYQYHLDASSQYKTDGGKETLVVNQDLKKKMNTLNVLLLKAFGFADDAQTLRKMGNFEIEDDIKKELDDEEKRKERRSIIAPIFIATAWLAPGVLSFVYFPAGIFGWCGYSVFLLMLIMGNGDTDKNLGAKQSFNSWIKAIGLKVTLNPEDPHKTTFIDAIIDQIKEDKTFFTRWFGGYSDKLNSIYQSSLTVATAAPSPEAVAVAAVKEGFDATSSHSLQSVSANNTSSSSSDSDSDSDSNPDSDPKLKNPAFA